MLSSSYSFFTEADVGALRCGYPEPGRSPERRMRLRVRSRMRTGRPISWTKISTAGSYRRGLKDELGCLRDGHEVAANFGAGDGNGPVAADAATARWA